MSLKERVVDLNAKYGKQISASTLNVYYKKAGVTFRRVDLHATNKLRNATRILREQQNFVRTLRTAKAARRFIFYLDETSVCLWSPLKRRTFTNGEIMLPLQS